jgi:hypothetical protein
VEVEAQRIDPGRAEVVAPSAKVVVDVEEDRVRERLRTRLRRVVHQPVEGPVVLDGPGVEVVGTVEEEPQAMRSESGAKGARVASATLSVGRHRARRGVDLHPREPGRPIGVEEGGRGPLVTMDVEAEAGAELVRHDHDDALEPATTCDRSVMGL